MAVPKNMTGARAKVSVTDGGPNSNFIGIFSNFGYNVDYGVQPSYILGRYSPAALTYTDVSPVRCRAQGYRVIDHGPFAKDGGNVPKIQDLLLFTPLDFTVTDRASAPNIKEIAKIRGCLPLGESGNFTARQLSELPLEYVGLIHSDETASDNAESADSSDLP